MPATRPVLPPAGSDSMEKARTRALRLLKVRPRSESELHQRLARIGFGEQVIRALLQELKQKGLIDDTKFAQLFANQKMHSNPVGRRALMGSLEAKGIDSELVLKAVDQTMEGQDELETARGLAHKRLGQMKGLKRDVRQRRLFGFLSRRGFPSDVIDRVLREIPADEQFRSSKKFSEFL